MPSRLTSSFECLKAAGEKALVAYVTAGDPDLARSAAIIEVVLASGADVLELGVPFSDPTADGPVIQRAAVRALAAGATLATVLELVRQTRAKGHTQPIVLFGYYNPFLQYGLERLAADAAAAGADGFLVVDLPPEHAGALAAACQPHGLDLIYLLAPTSDDSRIAAVKDLASGFVYYVSRTGVTGAAPPDAAEVRQQVERIHGTLALPVCVGFGISSPEQVAAMGAVAEGVVVGTALVQLIEQLHEAGQVGSLDALARRVQALKAPLRPGGLTHPAASER